MKRFLFLSIATLILTACGGGGSDTPVSSGSYSLPNPASLRLERPPVSSLPADLLPPG